MIRLTDATILAYTKLRTHKIRTGLTVGVAGIMFGLILASIFVVQGVFDSADRFAQGGLSDRTIMAVGSVDAASADVYELAGDADFILHVETIHRETVEKKRAAAKKYSVDYQPERDDISPVVIDAATKKKSIPEENFSNPYVANALEEYTARESEESFDVYEFAAKYPSAKVIPEYRQLVDAAGMPLPYMADGKESFVQDADERTGSDSPEGLAGPGTLSVLDGDVAASFVSNTTFDASKGEVPVILPYSAAERALKLPALSRKASSQEKLQRIREVRQRIGEVTASFCYRNPASQQMISLALQQQAERKLAGDSYTEPTRVYRLPDATSCGAVTVVKDSRSAAEKLNDANVASYEKEIGASLGEPVQHKMVLRGVGVAGDMGGGSMATGVASAVQGLLGSHLGYDVWVIPSNLLQDLPQEARPDSIFKPAEKGQRRAGGVMGMSEYLVEFTDKADARKALVDTGMLGTMSVSDASSVYLTQYGSNSLLIDEMKTMLTKVFLWVLGIVGGVAMIIMASMIGRTVSEGRRESAVFRSIGAKRSDIGMIYGAYALLLSLRTVLFAAVLGVALALLVEVLYWREATVGAHLAYSIADMSKEFHLFSIWSWHVPLVVGVMLVIGVVASVIPIVRSVRRNPINDMRDDT